MPSVVIAGAVAIVVAATIAVAIRDELCSLGYLLFRACTEAKSLIILCLLVSRSHRQRLLPAA